MLRNSFYYIPKNTYTFMIGSGEINKYLFNNPFDKVGFDFSLEIDKPITNLFYNNQMKYYDVNVDINYKLTHFHNNRVYTQLHINDTLNNIYLKEFFYVKPYYNDIAKINYFLEYNKECVYNIEFDTLYNPDCNKYKYALFDKNRLYDIFSKKYII